MSMLIRRGQGSGFVEGEPAPGLPGAGSPPGMPMGRPGPMRRRLLGQRPGGVGGRPVGPPGPLGGPLGDLRGGMTGNPGPMKPPSEPLGGPASDQRGVPPGSGGMYGGPTPLRGPVPPVGAVRPPARRPVRPPVSAPTPAPAPGQPGSGTGPMAQRNWAARHAQEGPMGGPGGGENPELPGPVRQKRDVPAGVQAAALRGM